MSDVDKTAWSFETRQIHAGTAPDPTTGARALPIYATTAYQFRDSQHAADLFALAEMGNIYTRIMNPTQDALEQRVASLEGGVAALAVSSGQSATTLALLNIAEAGDHVVASASLYGGTYNLLHHSLPKLGITVSFVEDPDDAENWQSLVQDNTKAFFAETIGNPKGDGLEVEDAGDVLDLETVAGVAHRNGVPLIVDNTIATPFLIRPFEHGADVVVHSATKYLGGHGTAIAGVIVDGGGFDWTSGKFPGFTTPDPTYHGVVYADLGAPAYALKARVQLLRDLGPAISPFNAFLVVQGIETLSLRMERHVANALRVAEFLEAHDEVDRVNYPGLASSPWHAAQQKYAPKGAGAVLTFELHGGREAGQRFVEALELHSHVANIGDVRSLVIHPASTTHSQLTAEEQLTTGVTPGLVRLAVGLEGIEDILADLESGFRAAKGA
jgi:O-acetylhomoserine (thiol)-lyase